MNTSVDGTTKELECFTGLFYKEKADIPQSIYDKAQARWDAKKSKDFQTNALRSDIESAGFLRKIRLKASGFKKQIKPLFP